MKKLVSFMALVAALSFNNTFFAAEEQKGNVNKVFISNKNITNKSDGSFALTCSFNNGDGKTCDEVRISHLDKNDINFVVRSYDHNDFAIVADDGIGVYHCEEKEFELRQAFVEFGEYKIKDVDFEGSDTLVITTDDSKTYWNIDSGELLNRVGIEYDIEVVIPEESGMRCRGNCISSSDIESIRKLYDTVKESDKLSKVYRSEIFNNVLVATGVLFLTGVLYTVS